MVAFDNTVLSLLVFPDAEQRQGKDAVLIEHARERVLGLVKKLDAERDHVVVPSPALAEVLVTEGADMQAILSELRTSAFIRIESFDERAAVELAIRLREARRAGDQREGLAITKNAMKFDRQIVAIALVNGASVLYSDDAGVAKFAAGCGLTVKGVADLPVPAEQQTLEFTDPAALHPGAPSAVGDELSEAREEAGEQQAPDAPTSDSDVAPGPPQDPATPWT